METNYLRIDNFNEMKSEKEMFESVYGKRRFKFWVGVVFVIGICLIIVNCIISIYFPNLTPVITVGEGQIQGRVAYSRDGREYWQFLSIPYAEPPLGNLRFKPPIPAKSWNGTKRAIFMPPFCVQFEALVTQYTVGEEDCLFLNVFAHPLKNESQNLKPVLLHIHGGGYIFGGSKIFLPDYFIDDEIIIVTLNYRLGPFGFINFQHDSEVDGVDLPRGNMAMKDQLLAMKWVQKNIANFGGDPDKVLLFGESAGGVSVQLHVLSPKSKGLFYRAWSDSGSPYSPCVYTTQPRKIAKNFAKRLGCPIENSSALLECIQNYDPWEMVKYQLCASDPTLPKDTLSPSVEHFFGEDAFLHEHPMVIMDSGNFSKVPFVYGVSSGDGGLRTGKFEALPHALPALKSNWTEILKNSLLWDRLSDSAAEDIRKYFFGSCENFKSLNNQAFLGELVKLHSDIFVFEPIHRSAIGHAKSGAPTYMYYYDYVPNAFPGLYTSYKAGYAPGDWIPTPIKLWFIMMADWSKEHIFGGKGAHLYGVTHGEDVFQLWNVFGISKYFNYWDTDFSKSYVKLIVDFANGTNDLQFKGTQWISINSAVMNASGNQSIPYLVLENAKVSKVIPEPFAERIRFWQSMDITRFNY